MAYNVFESTNMKSTRGAEKIYDVVAETDIENGTFGYVEALATGETNTYAFKAGTKSGCPVLVADQPAWDEDTSKIENQRKDKFIIPAGTRFRARVVALNDKFSIAAEGFTSATKANAKVNKYVTIDNATGKLIVADSASSSSPIMEGKIEEARQTGGTLSTAAHVYGYARTMYVIRVTTLK